jgi:hypothetical protein
MSIGFWEKESGHMFSYGKGLSEEQVKELKSLKVGDRLILFKNDGSRPNSPHFSLKKSTYKKPELVKPSEKEETIEEQNNV